ncbi:hypothetical protein YC2023_059345 [Brassica napus]
MNSSYTLFPRQESPSTLLLARRVFAHSFPRSRVIAHSHLKMRVVTHSSCHHVLIRMSPTTQSVGPGEYSNFATLEECGKHQVNISCVFTFFLTHE